MWLRILFVWWNNNDEPNTLSDGQLDANNNGMPDYMEVGPLPEPNTDQGGGGFISGLFGGGDGMKTYYTCQNGQVISGQYKRAEEVLIVFGCFNAVKYSTSNFRK